MGQNHIVLNISADMDFVGILFVKFVSHTPIVLGLVPVMERQPAERGHSEVGVVLKEDIGVGRDVRLDQLSGAFLLVNKSSASFEILGFEPGFLGTLFRGLAPFEDLSMVLDGKVRFFLSFFGSVENPENSENQMT
jgi:hypothetical protein